MDVDSAKVIDTTNIQFTETKKFHEAQNLTH
jgi:hypothetical protein